MSTLTSFSLKAPVNFNGHSVWTCLDFSVNISRLKQGHVQSYHVYTYLLHPGSFDRPQQKQCVNMSRLQLRHVYCLEISPHLPSSPWKLWQTSVETVCEHSWNFVCVLTQALSEHPPPDPSQFSSASLNKIKLRNPGTNFEKSTKTIHIYSLVYFKVLSIKGCFV